MAGIYFVADAVVSKLYFLRHGRTWRAVEEGLATKPHCFVNAWWSWIAWTVKAWRARLTFRHVAGALSLKTDREEVSHCQVQRRGTSNGVGTFNQAISSARTLILDSI